MTGDYPGGVWICCDGVEGAGKTTLVNGLAERLGGTVAPEFSQSATGRALAFAVKTAPHYIATSTWGQSLAFIGDFHETYEASVLPALNDDRIVISDRGWLSKYAYQAQVLSDTFDAFEVDDRLFRILTIPRMPDLTFHLDAELNVLVARLVERDGSCPPDRTRFVEGARDRYLNLVDRVGTPQVPDLKVYRLPSLTREATLNEALAALEALGLSTAS